MIGEPYGPLSVARYPRLTTRRLDGDGAVRAVVVVSDGSDARGRSRAAVRTGLLTAAVSLRERVGIKATARLVHADSAQELITELHGLSRDNSAIYLVGTDSVRGRVAQVALSGTLPVITDRQTLAVVTLAATLTILTRAGVDLADGQLLIVGAERDRLVAQLGVAAGIGEINSWGLDDAHSFPLRALAHRATVVIDLLGPAERGHMTRIREPGDRVVTVDDPTIALLALPGLIAAAVTAGRPPDHTACLAWARALAERTPPDRILPTLTDAAALRARLPHPLG